MTDLSQFDVAKKTTSYRQDIFLSLRDTLSLGLAEFSKSLTHLFSLGGGTTKHQITKQFAAWERSLQRRRGM